MKLLMSEKCGRSSITRCAFRSLFFELNQKKSDRLGRFSTIFKKFKKRPMNHYIRFRRFVFGKNQDSQNGQNSKT